MITGSDDRLVKFWSAETGLCLRSCRGHEVWCLLLPSHTSVIDILLSDLIIQGVEYVFCRFVLDSSMSFCFMIVKICCFH